MSIKINKFEKQNSEMEAFFNSLETRAKYNVQNPFHDVNDVLDTLDGIVRGQIDVADKKEKKELKKVIKFLLKYL